MVIAIDLDGVVFDSEEYFRTYSQIYDLENDGCGVVDSEEMNSFKRLGWTKKTADVFYEKYTAEVLEKAPIKPYAKYVMDKLKDMGHKLICITCRGYYRQCEIDITEKRLKEANIVFDKIIYNQNDKLDACLKEKIDVIIDDNHSIIEKLSNNNIKCLHFRGAGIKKVENKNVIVVQNWASILEYFLKNK